MLKRNLLSRQVARQDCRIFTYLAVGYCAHLRTPAVNYPNTSKNRVLSWRNERAPPTWLIESVHLHTTVVPVSYQSRRLKKNNFFHSPSVRALISKTGEEGLSLQQYRYSRPTEIPLARCTRSSISTGTASSIVILGHASTYDGTKRGCLGA